MRRESESEKQNERDKLTKKKKKRRGRRSRKAEYELFFKRQTLLLDLSPRIKVKSKKRTQRISVKGRVTEYERECERKSE